MGLGAPSLTLLLAVLDKNQCGRVDNWLKPFRFAPQHQFPSSSQAWFFAYLSGNGSLHVTPLLQSDGGGHNEWAESPMSVQWFLTALLGV